MDFDFFLDLVANKLCVLPYYRHWYQASIPFDVLKAHGMEHFASLNLSSLLLNAKNNLNSFSASSSGEGMKTSSTGAVIRR